MQCAITGANGFIGSALTTSLVQRGHTVAGWSRSSGFDLTATSPAADRSWIEQLRGSDAVIHLAAHVHVGGADRSVESERHRQINHRGTLRLATAALAAGARHFIFLSTAKVFGEGENGPYGPQSPAQPQDAYSQSKWQAEQDLQQLVATTPMALTIIRPPLVYGPGVSANFARLSQLARLPIPLPLAAIKNRRDMIGIDNLVDLIATCLDRPAAFGKIFLCSDGHPYSIGEVVANIRAASDKPRHLFALPANWINALGTAVLGKAAAQRLFGNFELDIAATCAALEWRPQQTMTAILQSRGRHPS
ncbi:MAG TPA: NAD-dependent epimerase/dehydratase family protein [Spongiibacteraceae bacterium]|nr:NAD-dependent epimerase/dehydratase family protein [Spongiibacteraceae bacterium]